MMAISLVFVIGGLVLGVALIGALILIGVVVFSKKNESSDHRTHD